MKQTHNQKVGESNLCSIIRPNIVDYLNIPGVNKPSGMMLRTTSGHACNSPEVETVDMRESAPSTAIEYVRESSPEQEVESVTWEFSSHGMIAVRCSEVIL